MPLRCVQFDASCIRGICDVAPAPDRVQQVGSLLASNRFKLLWGQRQRRTAGGQDAERAVAGRQPALRRLLCRQPPALIETRLNFSCTNCVVFTTGPDAVVAHMPFAEIRVFAPKTPLVLCGQPGGRPVMGLQLRWVLQVQLPLQLPQGGRGAHDATRPQVLLLLLLF